MEVTNDHVRGTLALPPRTSPDGAAPRAAWPRRPRSTLRPTRLLAGSVARDGLRARRAPLARAPWRRPRGDPAAAGGGVPQRLPADGGDPEPQRRRLAPQPRLDLPGAFPARG